MVIWFIFGYLLICVNLVYFPQFGKFLREKNLATLLHVKDKMVA
jgi:hypothetical protein